MESRREELKKVKFGILLGGKEKINLHLLVIIKQQLEENQRNIGIFSIRVVLQVCI